MKLSNSELNTIIFQENFSGDYTPDELDLKKAKSRGFATIKEMNDHDKKNDPYFLFV